MFEYVYRHRNLFKLEALEIIRVAYKNNYRLQSNEVTGKTEGFIPTSTM